MSLDDNSWAMLLTSPDSPFSKGTAPDLLENGIGGGALRADLMVPALNLAMD